MPAVLNAANEVAVKAFLEERIGFRDIHQVIRMTTEAHTGTQPRDLGEILEVDCWARNYASAYVANGLKEKRT